jgi:hypothetical protein
VPLPPDEVRQVLQLVRRQHREHLHRGTEDLGEVLGIGEGGEVVHLVVDIFDGLIAQQQHACVRRCVDGLLHGVDPHLRHAESLPLRRVA